MRSFRAACRQVAALATVLGLLFALSVTAQTAAALESDDGAGPTGETTEAWGSHSWPHEPTTVTIGTDGMAATAHPIASRAALEVLRDGGNAVDAAVAAVFTLAVVEPWSSGIGGGGFMLLHRPMDGETLVLDFREHAPLGAYRDMYIRGGEYLEEISRSGWLAVATPGAVAGLLQALDRWGSLSRERILEPAVRAAEGGFAVTEEYQRAANRALEKLRADEEASRIFLVAAGDSEDRFEPPPLGHILTQPDLARTLRKIATEGEDGFYEGEVAASIAAASRAGGGLITRQDLAAYRPAQRDPLVFEFHDLVVHAMPPPSSGGIALAQILGVAERFDLTREGFDDPRRVHLMAEAMRRAFSDRNEHIGDPAFVKNPVDELTGERYLAGLHRGIDPLRATSSSRIPDRTADLVASSGGEQTTHVSVIDAAGNAVSLTHTINYTFGAGVVAPGTGVLMNNEMDDFSAAPGRPNLYGLVQSEANAIAPRKVPLSSMSPTIVLRRDELGHEHVHMVLGSPGGPTIITQVAELLVNIHLFGMDAGEAVAAPRIHHQWLPDRIMLEDGGFSEETMEELKALGHEIHTRTGWGNAQIILVDPDTALLKGASDPRGRGSAMGL